MRDTLPFLVRLGLEAGADAKDIRRAYARELKKIDQAADPAGFQELRSAYEVALQWQAHRQLGQQAVAAPAGTGPAPAHDDPYQLADQALHEFASSMESLLQSGQARHLSRWKATLHASLDSNTLLNLTARTIFEARIVHLLASGWEPGHETLFVAACEVFDWARDSRRIMQFGEAGAVVNRAIDEWKLYESMPATSIGTVKQLIQLVRRTPKPEGTAARNDLLLFHELAGRFYSWLAIIVDRAILQEWSNAAQAELQRAGPGPAASLHASEGPVEPARTSSWGAGAGWSLALLAYFLIKGCAAFMSH